MGQFARVMLFVGALAILPLAGSSSSSSDTVKMDKGGVSFSVGSGQGYYGRGYGRGAYRYGGRGYHRGYYRPYYNNYYGYNNYYPYGYNGAVVVI